MAAVPLSQANRAYITLAPPWSKRLFKLGRLAWGPGENPPQLRPYQSGERRNEALRRAQAVVQANKTGASKKRR